MYVMICPKCGKVRKKHNRSNVCDFCNTELVQTNYPEKDYYQLDGKGGVNERLRRKYVRKSKLYSEKAEKAMIKASNAEYLADLRKRLDAQNATPTLTTCPVCQGKVSSAAPTCPHCGHPIAVQSQPVQRSVREEPTGPKCPTCGSRKIEKIGYFDRATSVMFWGFASRKMGKTMTCRDCGYKW